MNINYFKLFLAALGMICVTVLMALNSIESAAGMPIITLIVGYCVGNGIASKQDQPVQPIFGSRRDAEPHFEIPAPAVLHVKPITGEIPVTPTKGP
ncbi:MAG: hypothetical protein QOE09_378 [Ilumatobacteraceae bacterium]|jgi:hypothetical protein